MCLIVLLLFCFAYGRWLAFRLGCRCFGLLGAVVGLLFLVGVLGLFICFGVGFYHVLVFVAFSFVC